MYIKNINKNIFTEYGRTLFFPSNFCSQSSNTGDSEYVSELFFLGNVLLKVLEFDTAKIKRKNSIKKRHAKYSIPYALKFSYL